MWIWCILSLIQFKLYYNHLQAFALIKRSVVSLLVDQIFFIKSVFYHLTVWFTEPFKILDIIQLTILNIKTINLLNIAGSNVIDVQLFSHFYQFVCNCTALFFRMKFVSLGLEKCIKLYFDTCQCYSSVSVDFFFQDSIK